MNSAILTLNTMIAGLSTRLQAMFLLTAYIMFQHWRAKDNTWTLFGKPVQCISYDSLVVEKVQHFHHSFLAGEVSFFSHIQPIYDSPNSHFTGKNFMNHYKMLNVFTPFAKIDRSILHSSAVDFARIKFRTITCVTHFLLRYLLCKFNVTVVQVID